MKKSFTYLIIALSLLTNWQCKKNTIDPNKYSDPKINPEVLTPLASAKIRITDILKQDSIIKYDADGLIRLTVKQDNVLSVIADTVLKELKLGRNNTKLSIGSISINNITESANIKLDDIVAGLNDTLRDYIRFRDGSKDTFPKINTNYGSLTNIAESQEYEYLKISNGFLVFKVTNRLPTRISKMELKLFDNKPTQTLVGSAMVLNMEPNQSLEDSISIGGKTLSNNLGFVVPSIVIDKSQDSVLIDLTNSIDVDVRYSRVKCIGGKAIIPAQTLNMQSLSVDLTNPTLNSRFRNVELSDAVLPLETTSTINTQINVEAYLPDATKDGSPLGKIEFAVPTGKNNTQVDLSNSKVFLGADSKKDHNMLRLNLIIKIQPSLGMVEFDSSNSILMDFDARNARFNYLDGFLGTRSYDFNINGLDVSQLAELGKGLRLENPSMTIKMKNSAGIPVVAKFDIVARDKDGNKLDLNAPDLNLPYPSIAERGTSKSVEFVIDKSNSNIVNCLSMPAASFDLIGTATMNPDGFTGTFDNHVTDKSSFSVGFEANVPMTLTAKNFTYKDTSNVGSSLRGLTDFDFVELKIKTTNGFPMSGSLDLIFTDSLYAPIDSLKDVTLLVSGIANSNGRVVTPSENMSSFLLEKQTLQKLDAEKCKYIIFKTKFDTYNNGNTPVSIYTDCTLDISIALRAKYNKQF